MKGALSENSDELFSFYRTFNKDWRILFYYTNILFAIFVRIEAGDRNEKFIYNTQTA